MRDIPTIVLPDRGHFGPRIRVEFERDVLLAILDAAALELGRLEDLRMNGQLAHEPIAERMRRAVGTACNDLIRLRAALEAGNLL